MNDSYLVILITESNCDIMVNVSMDEHQPTVEFGKAVRISSKRRIAVFEEIFESGFLIDQHLVHAHCLLRKSIGLGFCHGAGSTRAH
jgi:hypothetical protein